MVVLKQNQSYWGMHMFSKTDFGKLFFTRKFHDMLLPIILIPCD